jgi:hypothetical protein
MSMVRTRQEHAKFIGGCLQKGVEGFIEAGEGFLQAKHELPHGEYEAMVRDDLRMDPSTARRFAAIASHPVISNRAHGHALPPSWRTLYELTKLPQTLLLTKIGEGAVHPGMERKDARALLPAPEPAPEPEQRDDDLPPDYEGSAESEVEPAKPTDKHGRRKLVEIEVKRLASKLVELDRDLARELHKLCCEDVLGWQYQLECALARELGLEIEGNEPSAGNGADPDASAELRKTHFAESDPDRWIDGDTP